MFGVFLAELFPLDIFALFCSQFFIICCLGKKLQQIWVPIKLRTMPGNGLIKF